MQNHENLLVWRRSRDVAVEIVRLTRYVNAQLAPGMKSQLRRAAMSIPANIAEGAGADSPLEFARYLGIAIKSANEVSSHLALVTRLQPSFRGIEPVEQELAEIRRMLHALRAYRKRQGGQAR
ncbi:MAG: four helix bundle protein [Gemmatimonadaceae bacterium]|nr:four helix bundle protein [Gemmatimonadaceae bacterium]